MMNRFLLLTIILLNFAACNKKTSDMASNSKKSNDLINESSPYLLQHAYNPVNWKPWGDTALNQAEKEDKLLVISIGYASCHWCHVMEEESFEDDSIAALMNKSFINIKVDREERPDIDQIYMDAIQLMTGRGGWPLNVIALPDGRPVYAGTYHPKSQWKQILVQMSELYQKKPEELRDYAQKLTQGIHNYNLVEVNTEPALFTRGLLDAGINGQIDLWDRTMGGSRQAPKFPLPNKLEFLLRYGFQSNDEEVLDYVFTSLDHMAFGGIYDQIGGGFSRYSTDTKWHIPHFEKMLYDNAQLVSLYSKAYALTKKSLYKETVEETLEFIERELMNPEGGFFSSLDADSTNEEGELEEGAYYVWTKDELKSILGEDYETFSDYYNVNNYGAWEKGNFVLIRKLDTDEFAKSKGLEVETFKASLKSWKTRLLEARETRNRPRLDDKVLTSWNALMLKGYIDAYKTFKNPHYLEVALNNAKFIEANMTKEDGGLFHNYKDGKASVNGYLEDYATLIDGYIELYQVTADEKWLKRSVELTKYAEEHFYDEERALFFFTSDEDSALIARKTDVLDNVIPSSNSIMAQNLFELSHYYGDKGYLEKAEQMLNNIKPQMPQSPSSFSNWYLLMADMVGPYYEVAISGENATEKLLGFTKEYIPNALYAIATQESDIPLMENRFNEDDTFIYVCVNGTCKLPVKDISAALGQMELKFEEAEK